MAYLQDPPEDEQVQELYEADRQRLGHVANYTRTFAHRPVVYEAWRQLARAVQEGMDPVRYEVATVAAATELARRVTAAPADVREEDLEPLRSLGFDDAEILDVVLAAAARCFFSTVLEATGTEPDASYRRVAEPLRSVLTVGRPIPAG